jgi:hypothetical protein
LQTLQTIARRVPHLPQKRMPDGLSKLQLGHFKQEFWKEETPETQSDAIVL